MRNMFKKFISIFRFSHKKIAIRLFQYMAFNVIFVILICCFFNIFALTKFYTNEKTNELISVLYEIESIYEQNPSSESKNLMFEKISNDKNIHLIITDENNEVAYSSLPKDAVRFELRDGETDILPQDEPPSPKMIPNAASPEDNMEPDAQHAANSKSENYRRTHENDFVPPADKNNFSDEKHPSSAPKYNSTLVKETNKYKIYNIFNEKLNSFDIHLISTLDNGYDIRLFMALSPINEGTRYLNRFLLFAGGIAILICLIPMLFLTKSFTRPIRELSGIAKNMANLKFDKKYTGKQNNELGELGMSINTMSEKLEATITKLREDIIEKETVDKRRREFLSNVSHELKTPIALIEAYAEGLNENVAMSDEDKNYYCEVILDEADKMSNIIQKLMSLMRIESGEDTVEFSEYNINEQIQRIISAQTILISEKETLKIEFNPTHEVYVWADEFLIDEALTNYISNAVKYRTENSMIKIYTEQTGDKVRINVFNVAPPFTEEEKIKIWDRFYMSDKARTYVDGSRGLGLSIVSAIIKAHGEECGVENSDNGVVFYFTLTPAIGKKEVENKML